MSAARALSGVAEPSPQRRRDHGPLAVRGVVEAQVGKPAVDPMPDVGRRRQIARGRNSAQPEVDAGLERGGPVLIGTRQVSIEGDGAETRTGEEVDRNPWVAQQCTTDAAPDRAIASVSIRR